MIASQRKICKAVIPVAGFGTRLFPSTKVVKKELFPIIDREGRAKPLILAIVEEAINAGIEEIGIVVQKCDRSYFENFFKTAPKPELFNKLTPQNQEYSKYIQKLGNRITFLSQEVQEGFGHAIFCAKEWVKNEPFVVLLGDHVYSSELDKNCIRQLLDIYEQIGKSVVGVRFIPATEISHSGCVVGDWQEFKSLLKVTKLQEKPDVDYAKENLSIQGISNDLLLALFGIYVLVPEIFNYLQENIQQNIREQGEFQLTSCLDKLREEKGIWAYIVKGKTFDIGLPEAYRQTLIDFRDS